jgi:rhodanese-related sulfurtransferase
LAAETAIVVDVRNLASYRQAHVPGALHIPAEDLAGRLAELDRDRMVVFYDLTPSPDSVGAAMRLYDEGYLHVGVLQGGLQRWYADGYPIEGTLLTPTPSPTEPSWTVTPLITATLVLTPTQTQVPVTATLTVTTTATVTATVPTP